MTFSLQQKNFGWKQINHYICLYYEICNFVEFKLTMQLTKSKYIECIPKRRDGIPLITKSRIAVSDIVFWHLNQNKSIKDIVAMFEGINISQVYGALAYYFENKKQIDAILLEEENLLDELENNTPSNVYWFK